MGIICKNDRMFFDDLFKAIEQGDVAAGSRVKIAFQAFANAPRTKIGKQIQAMKKIQASGVSTDFSILTKDAFSVTIEEDNFDLGYEKAFRLVTLGEGQDTWEIYNVANGITFEKVEEGQRIQVNKLTGTKTSASVDYYGAALGWTDKMIRFRKIPAMVDLAMAFRNKFWADKADNHYTLISAAGAGNVTAYQGAATDTQLQRDIQTINTAAYTLSNRLKDKGYGDTASAKMVMYANPNDKARINAAFRSTSVDVQAGSRTTQQLVWNIDVHYTYNSNISSGSPQLVFPFNKIQRADAMQPTTYKMDKDPLTLNEVQAVWAIYGAAVADTDQVEQLTLS